MKYSRIISVWDTQVLGVPLLTKLVTLGEADAGPLRVRGHPACVERPPLGKIK